MSYGYGLEAGKDMLDIISNMEEYADHTNPRSYLEDQEEQSELTDWEKIKQELPPEVLLIIQEKIKQEATLKCGEYLRRISATIAEKTDIKKRALVGTFLPYCINPQILGAPSLQVLGDMFGYTRANVSRELKRFEDATGLHAPTSKDQNYRMKRRKINKSKSKK